MDQAIETATLMLGYLWQLVVIAMLRNFGFFAQLVMCIVVGIAMSQIIELPVLAIRDRWLPKTAGAKAPHAAASRTASAASP